MSASEKKNRGEKVVNGWFMVLLIVVFSIAYHYFFEGMFFLQETRIPNPATVYLLSFGSMVLLVRYYKKILHSRTM